MNTKEYDYPLVSVIIPVYNKEEFLAKALDSVINQTYKNIEIVCVNDCSTDKCPEILEEYAQKDSRIKIINNEVRQRLGITRNIGLENSKGDYILFLDADDFLEKNCLELLTEYTKKYPYINIVVSQKNHINYKTKRPIKLEYISNSCTDRIIDIYKEIEFIYYLPYYAVTGLLIRRKFLIENSILFKNYKSLEDLEYNNELLIHAKSLIISPHKLYNYVFGIPNSVSSIRYDNVSVIIDAIINLEKYKNTTPTEVYDALRMKLYRAAVEVGNEAYCNFRLSYDELKHIYENVIDHSTFSHPKMDYCRVKYERFLKYSPFFYRLISITIYYTKLYFPKFFSLLVQFKKMLNKKNN